MSRSQAPPELEVQAISPYFQSLAETQHDRDHGWHGARTIDHRADAQTLIQLNILTLFGELQC
jgi:hypothetical protein